MSNEKIKMRVNNDAESSCDNCGRKYNYTKEMYDLMLFGEIHQICFKCVDALFKKTLSAQTAYNGKIKSKEDMKRIQRSDVVESQK